MFTIHAAHKPSQTIPAESLMVNPSIVSQMDIDPVTGKRYMRLRAQPGLLAATCSAIVGLMHCRGDPNQIEEVPVCRLPLDVLGYIQPDHPALSMSRKAEP